MKLPFPMLCRMIFVSVLFAFTWADVLAAPPSDYRERLESARFVTTQLIQNLDDGDENESELMVELRKTVPTTETVKWPGGEVETDNAWLETGLKAFADEKDESARRAILIDISERLLALAESVRKIEESVAAGQTKDQDKQKLAEILSRPEYQKPEAKEESLFQRWWREFMEWLAKAFPRPDLSGASPSGFGSFRFGLQILIYVLLIAIVGFAIYKFAPFLGRKFKHRVKRKRQDRIILGERISADESASDLFGEAEQLAREGNLRAAIRKGYIALLCDLGDRKILRLARHKTNREYLRDVRKNKELFENINGLTQTFETYWYGLRTADQQDWEDFRAVYKRTVP